MTDNSIRKRPACADRSSPFPLQVKCPHCGADAEIWTDEKESTCRLCGVLICNTRTTYMEH